MILAVAGGKGGVGKSTVALELGAQLDAVVVDADLGMADLSTRRGPDLHDVLAGRADPLEAVSEEGPVALLPCGRTLAGARASDVTRLVGAVEAVEAAYDRVVVDCPAGMAADAGMPLLAADAALLVAEPREFALADAIRTRELARELDAGLVAVALNRTAERPPTRDPPTEVSPTEIPPTDGPPTDQSMTGGPPTDQSPTGRPPTDRIRRTLGAPVVAIPDDERVQRAQRHGWPVSAFAPESAPARRFEKLAETVRRSIL